MTKTTSPADPRDPFSADAEPRPWLREWVRQHMLKMAPLALATAAPLTNAACDSVPPPVCQASNWGSHVSSHAAWGEDHGNRIVLLALSVDDEDLRLPNSYTIVGGSFLTSGKSDQLRIKPDAGAEVITLDGTTTCWADWISRPISITIDLVPPDGGSADAAPIVTISS